MEYRMASLDGTITTYSCKLEALARAIALVKGAGFPPDIRDYHDFTVVTADPRCGNSAGAPYFSIKAA